MKKSLLLVNLLAFTACRSAVDPEENPPPGTQIGTEEAVPSEDTASDSSFNGDTGEPTLPYTITPIGEWELYRLEKQELHLESFNNDMSEVIYSMKWYDQTGSNSAESILNFEGDNTVQNFYADVLTAEGRWIEEPNGIYFSFNENSHQWSELTDLYQLSFYCDNTMSIEYRVPAPAGEHNFQESDWYIISYFRRPETSECDDLITYKVNE